MLLMIDNYDSFTYNLVQYFQELGETVKVVRNAKQRLTNFSSSIRIACAFLPDLALLLKPVFPRRRY